MVDYNRCVMALDLTKKVSSKMNVDFNDNRYQLSDKLKPATTKNIRQTFTIYDNKDEGAISSNEIAAAYALSDKKIPIGELLTKMTDLIVDLYDGQLDTDEDAVRAWKISRALLIIYADKKKRGEKLTVFDNSLKNSVINCPVFQQKYPNKYTLQTNFFDPKVIDGLVADIVETFEEDTVPKIHVAAIKQSRETAENHKNPVLDKIIQWCMQKYDCKVEPFFDISDDPETGLKYATNTVILHLKNGYDISIIGYTGTEHDNQFSVSMFDSNSLKINFSAEKCSPEELRKKIVEATNMESTEHITKLIRIEEEKNKVLQEQYDILKDIRPMIPAELLEIEVAESVVGHDYIWGCQQFRLTHNDLPEGFKLSDIELPEFNVENIDFDASNALNDVLSAIEGNKSSQSKNGVFAKLNAGETVEIEEEEPEVEKSSYAASTLLPGFIPTIKKTEEKAPSITAQADKAVAPKQPIFADAPSTRLPGLPVMPKVEEKPAQEPIKEEPVVATEEVKQTQLPFVAPPAAPEKPAEPTPAVDEIPGFSTTMIPGVTPPAPVAETPAAVFAPIEQPPAKEAQPEAPKKTESNANNSGEMSIEDMFA